MHEILKRLELIKTSIAIEDHEIIELQISKLTTMAIDEDVQSILEKLSNNDFTSLIADIEDYLNRYSGLVIYEDKEIQGLKLELKVLENKLQELSERKNEYLNDISEFNTRYHLCLGDLIQKILKTRQEIQYRFFQAKEVELRGELDEYEAIKREFQELKIKQVALEEELSQINEFDDRYDEVYDELQKIKEILEEKEIELNKKRKKVKKSKEKLNDTTAKDYRESKSEYEEFSNKYEDIKKKNPYELNDKEKEDLKKLFRKASKLCHPDIVSDELKEQATAIMQELNDAYSKKDLNKIKEILANLESGRSFDVASDTINDKERLKEKIKDIKMQLDKLKKEIEAVISNETFITIQEVDDLDEYFDNLKADLLSEYERLQQENSDIDPLKEKGDRYEKYIGTKFEKNGDLVIYNGLIMGYQDGGVDIAAISVDCNIINLIQCKHWRQRALEINDIEDVYSKLSNCSFDFLNLSARNINEHLYRKKENDTIESFILIARSNLKNFTLQKTLYISSDRVVNLDIGEYLIMIKPNVFKYKDMEIVIDKGLDI